MFLVYSNPASVIRWASTPSNQPPCSHLASLQAVMDVPVLCSALISHSEPVLLVAITALQLRKGFINDYLPIHLAGSWRWDVPACLHLLSHPQPFTKQHTTCAGLFCWEFSETRGNFPGFRVTVMQYVVGGRNTVIISFSNLVF